MSLYFYLFFALVGLLLLLFAWSVRRAGKQALPSPGAYSSEESGRRHMTYLPQIRQALVKADYDFLSKRVSAKTLRQVRRERRDVALAYLGALRDDFQGLLRVAKVIAVLSPEVAAMQEFERFRLTVKFMWRYELTRVRLLVGFAPVPQLDGLSNLVSGLSVRLEAAMKELGERAALAAELASSVHR